MSGVDSNDPDTNKPSDGCTSAVWGCMEELLDPALDEDVYVEPASSTTPTLVKDHLEKVEKSMVEEDNQQLSAPASMEVQEEDFVKTSTRPPGKGLMGFIRRRRLARQ
eukprot:CAMPEP_0198139062 /NCGR_PEP_ID=MMETSP1443-20131203/2401_1 /TAXON_ID=186043 /ORGANISM="Entomoneis sp., Strain CCMP2396" /LENGTH=107 /DNA_ID=CAMNT_0043801063 /DNA_START=172 /DNA_END=495 /DNA_ORIENTATION=-